MSDNEKQMYDSDEDGNINAKAHKRLLAGVSSLQKNQFIRKATRDEPAVKRSEFHLVKPSSEDGVKSKAGKKGKVDVDDLINVLDKTNKNLQLGKALKKTADKKKVLPRPLEKPAAEKLQRAINYEKAKEKLDRWDAIVAKNRSSDHLSFPLNQDASDIAIKDTCQMPSKFRIKSEMMLEMEKIEPQIFQAKEEQPNEIAEPKLTRAEMIQRSRELRQLRMKESQKSAKARLQNKIKSKKYHRILKKEKMKQQIKEFELLQKTDPEAALRKLEQLDKSRIEERANLRHRNTGSWAKNMQVRAKYDKDARKELADQIAISREITAKKPIDESDDEEDTAEATYNDDIDFDPFNPWLKTNNSHTNGDNSVADFVSGYRKYWQDRNQNEKDLKKYNDMDAVVEPTEEQFEEAPTKKSTKPRKLKQNKVVAPKVGKLKPSKENAGWFEEDIVTESAEIINNPTQQKKRDKKQKKQKKSKLVDNLDDLFDEAEEEIKDKFQKKLKTVSAELNAPNSKRKNQPTSPSDDEESTRPEFDLRFKSQNQRPKIDEELNGGEDENLLQSRIGKTLDALKAQNQSKSSNGNENNDDGDIENINPNDIAKVKTQHLQTAIPDTIYSNEDDGFVEYDDEDYHFDADKKLTIAEAFQDDDIVAEFSREKDEEAKKNEPKEIDMSLPGWGSWGGAGINPNKQKNKRRLILRFPAAEKRRVDNQGNVIIIENRDEKLQKHLVSNLPFPFNSVADYEQSIRAPIGKDFVPATAHRLLTKPSVITKSGTIIEPMNENSLVKSAKRPATKTERKIAKIVGDDD